MKRILMTLAAVATLAGASQAMAHPDDQDEGSYQNGSDWSNRGSGYNAFEAQYAHDIDGIRHGVSDGSFSRYQASVYFRELQDIRRVAYYSQTRGGYDNGYIQRRLEVLHARMHQAHDRGHDRQDRYYGGYGNGYGSNYGNGYRNNNGYRYDNGDDNR